MVAKTKPKPPANGKTKADLDVVKRFLNALDRDAGTWTFQTYDDDRKREDRKLARILHGTLAEHADELCSLNRKGAGVFVSINETDGKGRKEQNIVRVRAVQLDLDGTALDTVLAFLLKPHIIVESSPGRYHVYWLVNSFALNEYKDVQRAIAKRFDGDPAVALLTVVARLPGFFHNKSEPFQTRLVSLHAHNPHSADDILAEFPPEAKPHAPPKSVVVLPAGVPVDCAQAFVERYFVGKDADRHLHFYRGTFYSWKGTHYKQLPDDYIRQKLYAFLHRARAKTKDGECVPFNPTKEKVNVIIDALEFGVYLDPEPNAPFLWLPWQRVLPSDLDLTNFIAFRNGLLNIQTRELIPSTPAIFNVNALPFDYDPDAPKPERWWQFLFELWPDDKQAQLTLQEIFGLLLTADTSYQKIFMVVGPRRSGKGTIGHVATALLGRENVANPTMAALGTQFGLQPLIDKRLAIVADARLENKESTRAVEHLLSISGEDPLTIDRKNTTYWTGKLGVRFLILTNELPRFVDASGALASRFVGLTLKQSFLGKEQLDLKGELYRERPGILNWALRGLDRLKRRGRFAKVESSEQALRQLEDLAAPVAAFVRDKCRVGQGLRVLKSDLFRAYKAWCEEEGIVRPGSQIVFGRNLCAAFPLVSTGRSKVRTGRSETERVKIYRGIELTQDQDDPWDRPNAEPG